MSSTGTESQISVLVQCQISFRPLPSSVATFILIENFLYKVGGRNRHIEIDIDVKGIKD